ncbi:MAG: hypothetical protein U5J96_07370 [Ignavibacteriaceae bacterium]|nr:hypothetical protein [Ignavibacteriaceae bacterium]
MIKIYGIILLMCIFVSAFAQSPVNKISKALETKLINVAANDEILVWIYFTDKRREYTIFYFSNPKSVVSEKSIKKKKKKFLSILHLLTMKDIPVNSDYIFSRLNHKD